MQASVPSATPRLHPLVVAAAASVTLVSIVGVAAILGVFPTSQAVPAAPLAAPVQQPVALAPAITPDPMQLTAAAPTRFQTADGRVFEEVPAPGARPVTVEAPPAVAAPSPKPAKAVQHKVVHHSAPAPAPVAPQRETAQQAEAAQHPVRSYVSDMSPVGTGIGAVVGGALGHQVGGGNGKKLATVAGALLGGYAGNEIAHDRNPVPFTDGK
jgi:uncharacterized protein YcfJ